MMQRQIIAILCAEYNTIADLKIHAKNEEEKKYKNRMYDLDKMIRSLKIEIGKAPQKKCRLKVY